MNPCFTTLCNQMLSLAMVWDFQIFHLFQPQQPPIFCTTCYLIRCMQRSVFLQFCDKTQSSIHQILTRCIQQFLQDGHAWRVPQNFHRPPSNNVSSHFTIETLLSVASPFFLHYNPPKLPQTIHKISIDPDKVPHTLFFCIKQNSLFRDSPPSISRYKSRRHMNSVASD